MIKKNVGKTDMYIRVLVGVVLILLAMSTLQGTMQIVATVAGTVFLLTGVFNFCPLYSILGISSIKKK